MRTAQAVRGQGRTLYLGGCGLGLLAMACASTTPPPHVVSGMPELNEAGSPAFRPDQIFTILDESSIEYSIKSDAAVGGRHVARVVRGPVRHFLPIDAFLWREPAAPDEPVQVRSRRPPPDIAEVFDRAGDALDAGDYQAAHRLYTEAIELRPNYFKTYTYLGNTLHYLGELRLAEAAFLRALELNPIDYQALLFLGDTYMQLGDYYAAKRVLVRAFMLNQDNLAVQDRLRVTLAKLSLRIRELRLNPEVRIRRRTRGKVEIGIDRDRGLRWLALAACMACWAFEDRCARRSSEEDDPLRIAMYRECLAHQAVSIAVRQEKDEASVPTDERKLLSAIEDGFLPAIVFWEIVAHIAPRVIFVLPERMHDEIVQYIERYVIVSSAVAQAGPSIDIDGSSARDRGYEASRSCRSCREENTDRFVFGFPSAFDRSRAR